MKTFKRILITGTTSGLGSAFLKHFDALGSEVYSVNKERDPEFEKRFPNQHFAELDIADFKAVFDYLKDLKDSGSGPDLFILNAGINKPDNVTSFDVKIFSRVMRTNLDGVLNFVSGIQSLGWRDRTIMGMSSTSNIVANPGHAAYHISKWAIHRMFRLLRAKDSANQYKTVILGPVHTNIMAGYPKPTGLQGKLFDWMAVPAEEAARRCVSFVASGRRTFYYPLWVCGFYHLINLLLQVLPGLYRGSSKRPD